MYNMTLLAVQLNEPEEGVAPTDSRLRPDQRLMEQASWDEANELKAKLEDRQRLTQRIREEEAERAIQTGSGFSNLTSCPLLILVYLITVLNSYHTHQRGSLEVRTLSRATRYIWSVVVVLTARSNIGTAKNATIGKDVPIFILIKGSLHSAQPWHGFLADHFCTRQAIAVACRLKD